MPKQGPVSEAERIRRRAGLSVTELARRAGFSHSLVSQVEGGRLRPSKRYRSAVSKALRVPVRVAFPDVGEAG